ncbi:alpha/beta hydrolase [Ruminiclostridium herbifermentans]|uniref:Alpha/beta hydrolase n=1 Tax=Ruminiclostridium herbifermentans TaxID=2488810 RepID=A0A4U7JDF9_9FIRM|nr:alpha/beta hydrolase [Ruminiclostridium herbifermentans]QNU67864.1 alpha/beta hydrolase [Ruminiclostridium herbifermentans]
MSYETEYSQFVESKQPLASLQEEDFKIYSNCGTVYNSLNHLVDQSSIDYFEVQYGEEPLQNLDIRRLKTNAQKQRPVVLFIHGGGWNAEDKNSCIYSGALSWVKKDYVVVAINYRLSPNVIHPLQVEDCAKGLKWLIDNIKDFGGNPDEICVIGHSAGAHLAALLVSGEKWHKKFEIDINKVKCWIPVSGVYDLSLPENYLHPIIKASIDTMLGDADINDCSPIKHITGKEPPCLILHGGDDWLVPSTNSLKLYEMLIEKGTDKVKYIKVPGYWHFNMMLGYDIEGHKVAEIINDYLEEMLSD